jgi:hypothetical protein
MRSGPSALQGSVRLGHFIPTARFTQIFLAQNAAHFFYRAKKTSHTAGTLGEIKIEYVEKNCKNY